MLIYDIFLLECFIKSFYCEPSVKCWGKRQSDLLPWNQEWHIIPSLALKMTIILLVAAAVKNMGMAWGKWIQALIYLPALPASWWTVTHPSWDGGPQGGKMVDSIQTGCLCGLPWHLKSEGTMAAPKLEASFQQVQTEECCCEEPGPQWVQVHFSLTCQDEARARPKVILTQLNDQGIQKLSCWRQCRAVGNRKSYLIPLQPIHLICADLDLNPILKMSHRFLLGAQRCAHRSIATSTAEMNVE